MSHATTSLSKRLLQGTSTSTLQCTCKPRRLGRRSASTQVDKRVDAVQEGAGTDAAGSSVVESSSSASYPFSESVIFPVQQISPKVKDQPWSVMDRVNQSLVLPSTSSFRGLFRKGSAERIPEGSIISVESYTGGSSPATCNSTSAFAGVLMAVKRRHQGVDDAFTVRASVGKPGVGTEVRFDVNSPWIKSIKVLRKNEDFRRAKLYYIRRSDKFLSGVQGAIRNSAIRSAELTNDAASANKTSPPTSSSSKKKVKQGSKK